MALYISYTVMQSDRNTFYGYVVLDNFNKASWDEDNFSDQIYKKQIFSDFLYFVGLLEKLSQNVKVLM